MRYFILFLIALATTLAADAQNTPNGSSLPTDPVTGRVAYPLNFDQSPNVTPTLFNYTRTYTPLEPMSSVPTFDNTTGTPILVQTSYMNGNGATMMDISRTNTGADIIKPYDNRPYNTSLDYLPYSSGYHKRFQTTVYNAQRNYYLSHFASEDTTGYVKTKAYSNNGIPTVTTYAPGKAHVGQERGVTATVNVNTGGEVYKLSFSGGNVCKSGTYPAAALTVKETNGQHGQRTLSYTNKTGQTLCQKVYAGIGNGNGGWLETYYVYDELGRVVCIVPPKASVQLATNTCLTNINLLCTIYTYDAFGAVTSTNVPGKSHTEVTIYNKKRQPVLHQTSLENAQDKYEFVVYDVRGRVVMTGILDNSAYNYSSQDWQEYLDNNSTANSMLVLLNNSYSGGFLSSPPTGAEVWTFNYYDDYSITPGTPTFNDDFTSDYLASTAMETPTPYYFTLGRLVASQVKILDNGIDNNFSNAWITSYYFYDEKGRVIQVQTDNPWSTDVTTTQYNFSGQPVLTIAEHNGSSSFNKSTTKIQTWNIYGAHTGQLLQIKQKYDQEQWHDITTYAYDNLGKVTTKWIGGVEKQAYDYDIRGALTGVNRDYVSAAVPTAMAYNVSFAEKLFYESGFSQRRYDGRISGFEWRTPSIPVSAYGYSYDSSGRLIQADFRDSTGNYPSPAAWNKEFHDFTVNNISYDDNGNKTKMRQYGYNTSWAPALIDDLDYKYDDGNKLESVTDDGANSQQDDFDNSVNGTANYEYDADGNLISDDNKSITISYDVNGRPLNVANSTTGEHIDNIYDAAGRLLQRTVTDGTYTNVYNYWGPFVYRNDSLLYVLHGEGRSRWLADSSIFKYDYFVRDHLGNVRASKCDDETPITTEYLATHEIASANIEEAIFSNIADVRDIRPLGSPGEEESALLNGGYEDKRIGTSLILHVMQGDKLTLQGYSYHEGKDPETDTYASPEAMFDALLGTLAGGVGGYEGGESGNGTHTTESLFTEPNWAKFQDVKDGITDPASPRAYLNYLVFDEEMNLMDEQSGAIQVSGTASQWELLSLPSDLVMQQNGYIAVFISNEQVMDVYFDNISIVHHQGRLLDEEHYYPHGMLISKSTSYSIEPENKFRFQTKQMQDELGMQLYDFHARQYDPQIGRFTALDPMGQYASGYTGMGNDPANLVDPTGMQTVGGGGARYPRYISPWEAQDIWANQHFMPGNYNTNLSNTFSYMPAVVQEQLSGGFGGSRALAITVTGPLDFGDGIRSIVTDGTSYRHGQPGFWAKYNTADYSQTGLSSQTNNFSQPGLVTVVNRFIPLSSLLGGYMSDIASAAGKYGQSKNEKWLATEVAEGVSGATIIPDAALNFIEKTKTGRFLSNGLRHISKAELASTMKLAKPLTRGIAIINLAATGTAVANDLSDGNFKSAGARVVVASVAAAAVFIPGIGWGVSIGIGVADAIWGDDFYNYVQNW